MELLGEVVGGYHGAGGLAVVAGEMQQLLLQQGVATFPIIADNLLKPMRIHWPTAVLHVWMNQLALVAVPVWKR
jgi:hypothetical protein